jgi:hypothetical protein
LRLQCVIFGPGAGDDEIGCGDLPENEGEGFQEEVEALLMGESSDGEQVRAGIGPSFGRDSMR